MDEEQGAQTSGRTANGLRRTHVVVVVALLLGVGALADWYGPTDSGDLLGSDAVQYMDIVRAIGRGDLRSALNPLWSQGYPLLMAAIRPVFPAGMVGDWWTSRAAALLVFCFCIASFSYLLETVESKGRRVAHERDPVFWLCGAGVFAAIEVGLGTVSRVSPDELVSGMFFLACALLLRVLRRPTLLSMAGFGTVLGIGFIVKSIFLPLSCLALLILVLALWRNGQKVIAAVPAVLMLSAFVFGYGAMLSHAAGYKTLGESGSLNYAWHVDRLAKWVHWEGGVQNAEAAWPSPRIARFVRWEQDPPDFGRPLHPSLILQEDPRIYSFDEPVVATYIPYYDPAYWYAGYKHVFRWRYQTIAIGKNLIDLAKSLFGQPLFYAVLVALWLLRGGRRERELWTVVAWAVLGVAIYLEVHLEGRYLSGFLAILAVAVLSLLVRAPVRVRRTVLGVILVGSAVQVVKEQRVVWSRAVHGWKYQDNVEWKVAEAVERSGLPRGSEIGMISWTANLHCDWAYFSGMRITSEIADGTNEKTFWGLDEAEKQRVMERFRSTGAKAVLSWDGPPSKVSAGWQRLGDTPMWMYRF